MKKRAIKPKLGKPPKISAADAPKPLPTSPVCPPVDLPAPPPPEVDLLPPSPISGHRLPASSLWKPGCAPPNPGGAPKGVRISTWLARFGEMTEDEIQGYIDNPRSLPANAKIALAQLRRAMDQLDGLPAAAWAADRVEGGVDRTVHLTHKQEPTMSLEDAAEMVKRIEKPDTF